VPKHYVLRLLKKSSPGATYILLDSKQENINVLITKNSPSRLKACFPNWLCLPNVSGGVGQQHQKQAAYTASTNECAMAAPSDNNLSQK